MIHFLSEADVKSVIGQRDITEAMEQGFSRLAARAAWNFDVVRRPLDYQNAIFGFKAAFDRSSPALGVKAGGLWPGNRDRGVPNHQSTIMLFDPDSGAPAALICGTYLTALRTAAASALSVRHLARRDAKVLGITAAGGQSEYQLRACFEERAFERILLPERASASGQRLAERLADLPAAVEVLPLAELCRASDVVVTMALSFEAYVEREWIAEGTHVACMGTDSIGKQEVAPELLAASAVFGDAPHQNAAMGECQHAVAAGLIAEADITPLGDVIAGTHPGRENGQDITLFDSTGMGLQDLVAAQVVLDKAIAKGAYLALDQWGTQAEAGAAAS